MVAVRKSELAALGLVNRRPMHGYRLNQAIQRMGLEHWTTLSRSSIYTALRRLARRNAVAITREREGNAPERTVYHLTPAGRELLMEILRDALSYVGPEDRYFYLGVAFAEALPVNETISLLETRCSRLRQAIAEERRQIAQRATVSPGLEHILAISEGGIRHAELEVEVCHRLIALLRSNPRYFARLQGAEDDHPCV